MKRPIVLAAGGTGGHVFPAEALAAELMRRGRPLALITDARAAGYEARFPGVAIHVVPAGSPSVAGLVPKLVAGLDIARGALAAGRVLRRLAPGAVVGFGGYPSLPAMIAAGRMNVPTIVHEQNAVLGRVNRLIAGRASAIAASFETIQGLRPDQAARVALTGNPVRDGIHAVRATTYAPPAPAQPVRLLVLGGSQGASIFADVVPAALALLPEELRLRLRITQQCRTEDMDRVGAAYAAQGIWAELAPFVKDVPSRLAAAHLVVARAGASTCAELAVVGRPALLVPYPHAMDDHQRANAEALAAGGAAIVMLQTAFTAEALAAQLERLVGAPASLAAMAAAARQAGRPDAAARLADVVELHARNGEPERRAA